MSSGLLFSQAGVIVAAVARFFIVINSCLTMVNILMICIFTSIAVSLLSILDNIATPCSVKA